jgi:hypothetical protein
MGNRGRPSGVLSGMRPLAARFTRLAALASIAALLVAGACAPGYPDRVPLGNWGGPHAGMVVSDTGAEIQYDCGAGRITAPLLLDSRGDFDLPGLYIRQGPGPVPANDSLLPRYPARYTGHSDGHTMAFTMTVENDSIPAQSFTLAYGGNPNVFKCL